jgi:deoxyribodipyrimidine photo-lyase
VIQPERIKALNDKAARNGDYVLYWMQQSQRASRNPALELAIQEANQRRLPVVVCFGLMADYPEANARHYTFMVQGLRDVDTQLRERGIAFVVKLGRPDTVALSLSADAAVLICDRGYLRHQKFWYQNVSARATCPVVQVEGDVVVPVELVHRFRETDRL